MKLCVSLSAPHVIIPYSGPTVYGTLHILLGDFTLSNRFVHGYDTIDTRGSVMSLGTAQLILDRMEIKSSSVCVYRESMGVVKGVAIRNDILDPLNFTIVVTRNLSPGPTYMFPDVNVRLEINNEIQVRYVM